MKHRVGGRTASTVAWAGVLCVVWGLSMASVVANPITRTGGTYSASTVRAHAENTDVLTYSNCAFNSKAVLLVDITNLAAAAAARASTNATVVIEGSTFASLAVVRIVGTTVPYHDSVAVHIVVDGCTFENALLLVESVELHGASTVTLRNIETTSTDSRTFLYPVWSHAQLPNSLIDGSAANGIETIGSVVLVGVLVNGSRANFTLCDARLTLAGDSTKQGPYKNAGLVYAAMVVARDARDRSLEVVDGGSLVLARLTFEVLTRRSNAAQALFMWRASVLCAGAGSRLRFADFNVTSLTKWSAAAVTCTRCDTFLIAGGAHTSFERWTVTQRSDEHGVVGLQWTESNITLASGAIFEMRDIGLRQDAVGTTGGVGVGNVISWRLRSTTVGISGGSVLRVTNLTSSAAARVGFATALFFHDSDVSVAAGSLLHFSDLQLAADSVAAGAAGVSVSGGALTVTSNGSFVVRDAVIDVTAWQQATPVFVGSQIAVQCTDGGHIIFGNITATGASQRSTAYGLRINALISVSRHAEVAFHRLNLNATSLDVNVHAVEVEAQSTVALTEGGVLRFSHCTIGAHYLSSASGQPSGFAYLVNPPTRIETGSAFLIHDCSIHVTQLVGSFGAARGVEFTRAEIMLDAASAFAIVDTTVRVVGLTTDKTAVGWTMANSAVAAAGFSTFTMSNVSFESSAHSFGFDPIVLESTPFDAANASSIVMHGLQFGTAERESAPFAKVNSALSLYNRSTWSVEHLTCIGVFAGDVISGPKITAAVDSAVSLRHVSRPAGVGAVFGCQNELSSGSVMVYDSIDAPQADHAAKAGRGSPSGSPPDTISAHCVAVKPNFEPFDSFRDTMFIRRLTCDAPVADWCVTDGFCDKGGPESAAVVDGACVCTCDASFIAAVAASRVVALTPRCTVVARVPPLLLPYLEDGVTTAAPPTTTTTAAPTTQATTSAVPVTTESATNSTASASADGETTTTARATSTGAPTTTAPPTATPPPSPSPVLRTQTVAAAATATRPLLAPSVTRTLRDAGGGLAADEEPALAVTPAARTTVTAATSASAVAAASLSPTGATKPALTARAMRFAAGDCGAGVASALDAWPSWVAVVVAFDIGSGDMARVRGSAVSTALAVLVVFAIAAWRARSAAAVVDTTAPPPAADSAPSSSDAAATRQPRTAGAFVVAAVGVVVAFYTPTLTELGIALLVGDGGVGIVLGLVALAASAGCTAAVCLGVCAVPLDDDAEATAVAASSSSPSSSHSFGVVATFASCVARPLCGEAVPTLHRAAVPLDVAAAHAVAVVTGLQQGGALATPAACRLGVAVCFATLLALLGYLLATRPYPWRAEQLVVSVTTLVAAALWGAVAIATFGDGATRDTMVRRVEVMALAADGTLIIAAVALAIATKACPHDRRSTDDGAGGKASTAAAAAVPLLVAPEAPPTAALRDDGGNAASVTNPLQVQQV